MGVYFFDSSALVKRYAAETGSTWVRHITHPISGNSIYIASITAVEVIAAIRRKVREQFLGSGEAQSAIADFRNDFASQYGVFNVTDAVIQRAMDLPERHQLRGYDAVQLAAAVIINAQSIGQGIPATGVPSLVLVACDDELIIAARAEGLAVDDPRDHP